jgi:hypothetical protein
VLQCVDSEGAALILGLAVLQCALQCIAVYCRVSQNVASEGRASNLNSGLVVASRNACLKTFLKSLLYVDCSILL